MKWKKKKKTQKLTTVVHEQEKNTGPMKNIFMLDSQEAAHQENLLELCTTFKKLSGKIWKPERPVQDKGEKPVLGEENQKGTLKSY